MARVRKCPNCGTHNGLEMTQCGSCKMSLSAEEIVEVAPSSAVAGGKEGVRCHAAGCGQMNAVGAAHCVYCNTALRSDCDRNAMGTTEKDANSLGGAISCVAREVVLAFPWGEVAIQSQLAIGRHPAFSSLSRELTNYDNVSGRHAQIWVEQNLVYLSDVGSTNGTFINGVAVPTGKTVAIKSGDQIRFAADLTAVLKVTE